MPLHYRRLTIIGIRARSSLSWNCVLQSTGGGGEQPLEAGPQVLLLPAAPRAVGERGCAGECGTCVRGEWEGWEERLFCAYVYLPVYDQAHKAGYASSEPGKLTKIYLRRMQTQTPPTKNMQANRDFPTQSSGMLNLVVIHRRRGAQLLYFFFPEGEKEQCKSRMFSELLPQLGCCAWKRPSLTP